MFIFAGFYLCQRTQVRSLVPGWAFMRGKKYADDEMPARQRAVFVGQLLLLRQLNPDAKAWEGKSNPFGD